MTVKELKKEFKLRNSVAKTIENIMVVPFLFSVIMAIVKFSIFWLVISVLFAIVQGMLYQMNANKWKVFLLDNKEKLDEDEKSKIKM